MPIGPFKVRAKEYTARFMRETNARHTIEVMEQVITALETDFGVSRQAAKIRLGTIPISVLKLTAIRKP
jgi:hypothetical protein